MGKRRTTAVLVALGVVAGGLAVAPTGPASGLGTTVPAVASSALQTNAKVRALAPVGGKVFLGGEFTKVRPSGAAAGTNETTRTYLAAATASTGALDTSFNHTLDGIVRALAVSLDGTTLYVGGDFTRVDGAVRNRLAAFNVATGALTSWAPSSSGYVNALAVSSSRVFVGGAFSKLAGVTTTNLGAVTTAGAGVPGFTATANNVVYAVAVSPAGDKLFIGGAFSSFNGDSTYHAAASASAATGATLPLSAISAVPVPSAGCTSVTKVVLTDATRAYFGNEGSGGGCYDGTWSANISDGTLAWRNGCLGATQGMTLLKGRLYVGSHAHNCQANTKDPDAFPEVGSILGLGRHLMAYDASNGFASSWYPNTNGGTGAALGPRALANDGSQVFVGGEFTEVNGKAQQGFARFAPLAGGASAKPSTPATPRAVALPGGAIAVSAQAPLDLDDTDLVLRLYRDGGATPIQTQDVHSLFWRRPVVTFIDTGVTSGSHTYTVDVIEKTGTQTSAKSPASPAVTSTSTVRAYQSSVLADSPSFFWRLGEPAGPVAADASRGGGGGGTYVSGITYGVPGPVSGDPTAVTTDGTSGLITSNQTSAPTSFSLEAWFRTTTTTGGKIIGFGDIASGLDVNRNPLRSKRYDRHVYLTNAGKLVFGVRNSSGTRVELTSGSSYNDGSWHHVVATQGSSGLRLYVDGAQVATNGTTSNQVYKGFWRVGGDTAAGWTSAPSSVYLAGTIADVAVYPTALPLSRVQAHWAASGR